jgi:carboxylesterase type B
LAAALRLVADRAADFGADPDRIYLMGHSAGANRVAAYLSHPEFHGPKGSRLAGALLSSGMYEIKTQDLDAGLASILAYFGADQSRYAERAALPGLVNTTTPFMMWSAELDPPNLAEQFVALKEAMCRSRRGCVRSLVLPHHSHMSEIYAIGTADTQLSDQILELIKTGK